MINNHKLIVGVVNLYTIADYQRREETSIIHTVSVQLILLDNSSSTMDVEAVYLLTARESKNAQSWLLRPVSNNKPNIRFSFLWLAIGFLITAISDSMVFNLILTGASLWSSKSSKVYTYITRYIEKNGLL